MADLIDEQRGMYPATDFSHNRVGEPVTGGRARREKAATGWSREAFLYRAASIANASDSADAAAKGILLELCRSGGWTFGRAYLRISADRATDGRWLIVTTGIPPLPAGFAAGEMLSAMELPAGSLAHTALTQDRGVAATTDYIAGLRAGCAVPVRYHGRVLGVFEVYTPGALPRERGLLDALLEAGEQLALVMVRRWNQRATLRQQQELAHTARLASMRELARNLAHEVNQPLAAVVSYAGGALQLLEQGRADPAKLKRALEQVGVQAKRASRIIQDFREFLRREEMRHEKLDLRLLISEAVALVESAAREAGVTLQLRLPPMLPPIEGDPVQLQQVLINLMH